MESRWMVFVDGENLTTRAQALAAAVGYSLTETNQDHQKCASTFYRKDVCYWPYNGPIRNVGHEPWVGLKIGETLARNAVRCHYYTSASHADFDDVRAELRKHGFAPNVFLKKAKQAKSKGVDIALTKDMLVHAFFDNYDLAVLVTGDGDFAPLIEEVMRLGKRVVVAFFDHKDSGLSPELKLKADCFLSLNQFVAFL